MHHQAGVNFENFTEVKFRDNLLTRTGHRHRRLNRDSPAQTGSYGRSNLNQNVKPKPKSNSGSFVKDHLPFFSPKVLPSRKVPPRGIGPPPPLVGALITAQLMGRRFTAATLLRAAKYRSKSKKFANFARIIPVKVCRFSAIKQQWPRLLGVHVANSLFAEANTLLIKAEQWLSEGQGFFSSTSCAQFPLWKNLFKPKRQD